ncbi:MAG: hypothetical protein EBQ92_02395, partial [Proteobacteria bacterium]|nr:hypothetical protein [Pseudomonadota bacterium]
MLGTWCPKKALFRFCPHLNQEIAFPSEVHPWNTACILSIRLGFDEDSSEWRNGEMRYVGWTVIFLTHLSRLAFSDCKPLFQKLSYKEIARSHQAILTDLKEG